MAQDDLGSLWTVVRPACMVPFSLLECDIFGNVATTLNPSSHSTPPLTHVHHHRSVDAALRRSIPAFNPEVAKVQRALEDIQYLLRCE